MYSKDTGLSHYHTTDSKVLPQVRRLHEEMSSLLRSVGSYEAEGILNSIRDSPDVRQI